MPIFVYWVVSSLMTCAVRKMIDKQTEKILGRWIEG